VRVRGEAAGAEGGDEIVMSAPAGVKLLGAVGVKVRMDNAR
jgi:hypothetical protein